MIATTTVTPEQERDLVQLAAYRERHAIEPIPTAAGWDVCEHDGIRINPIHNGWRHDNAAIVRLSDRTAGLVR